MSEVMYMDAVADAEDMFSMRGLSREARLVKGYNFSYFSAAIWGERLYTPGSDGIGSIRNHLTNVEHLNICSSDHAAAAEIIPKLVHRDHNLERIESAERCRLVALTSRSCFLASSTLTQFHHADSANLTLVKV